MGITVVDYPTVCLPHYAEYFARGRRVGKSGPRGPLAEVVAEYSRESPWRKACTWLA